jgi:uncharacterized membrane protein
VRRRYGLAAVLLVVLAWNVALFAAPRGTPRLAAASTYLVGSLICHQQPERSFYRNSAQLPVCARCLGLYVGSLVGVIGWVLVSGLEVAGGIRSRLSVRGWRRALTIGAIPTLASLALAWVGLWDGSNATRAALAVPLGAAIGAAIAAVAAGDLR